MNKFLPVLLSLIGFSAFAQNPRYVPGPWSVSSTGGGGIPIAGTGINVTTNGNNTYTITATGSAAATNVFYTAAGDNVVITTNVPNYLYTIAIYNAGGLTNFPVADTNLNGIITSNQFLTLSSYKTRTGNMLKPMRGWVTWGRGASGATSNYVWQAMRNFESWGMKEAGYIYMHVDDGAWLTTRSAGKIVANPTNFPGGDMRAFADYVHSRGYKLSLYQQWPTPNGLAYQKPDERGYEEVDATTFIVDYDADAVQHDVDPSIAGYSAGDFYRIKRSVNDIWAKVARSVNKPFILKDSFGNIKDNTTTVGWAADTMNMICIGDTHGDATDLNNWYAYGGGMTNYIADSNQRYAHSYYQSKLVFLDRAYNYRSYVGNGVCADPDRTSMNTYGTATQPGMNRTEVGLHAMLSAPLMLYSDLDGLSGAYWNSLISPYTNRIILQLQETFPMAEKIYSNNLSVIYSKPFSSTETAIAFNNRITNSTTTFTLQFTNIGYLPGTVLTVKDVWLQTDLGNFTNSFTTNVPACDTYIYTFRTPSVYLTASDTTRFLTNWQVAPTVFTTSAESQFGVISSNINGSFVGFGTAAAGYGSLQFYSAVSGLGNTAMFGNVDQTSLNVPNATAGSSGILFRGGGTLVYGKWHPTTGLFGLANNLTNSSGYYFADTNYASTNIIASTRLSYATNLQSGAVLDLTKAYQLLSIAANTTLTGVSGKSDTEVKHTVLMITNGVATNCSITLPTSWRTSDGARTYYVTNGQMAILSVNCYANSFTNAVCVNLW